MTKQNELFERCLANVTPEIKAEVFKNMNSSYEEYCFEKYLQVQLCGKYNMITQAKEAAEAAGLSMEDYSWVQHNYIKFKATFRDTFKKVYRQSLRNYLER